MRLFTYAGFLISLASSQLVWVFIMKIMIQFDILTLIWAVFSWSKNPHTNSDSILIILAFVCIHAVTALWIFKGGVSHCGETSVILAESGISACVGNHASRIENNISPLTTPPFASWVDFSLFDSPVMMIVTECKLACFFLPNRWLHFLWNSEVAIVKKIDK